MTEQIDHDQLFKKLLSTFFFEFIELFLPEVANYLEREPITFQYFSDKALPYPPNPPSLQGNGGKIHTDPCRRGDVRSC